MAAVIRASRVRFIIFSMLGIPDRSHDHYGRDGGSPPFLVKLHGPAVKILRGFRRPCFRGFVYRCDSRIATPRPTQNVVGSAAGDDGAVGGFRKLFQDQLNDPEPVARLDERDGLRDQRDDRIQVEADGLQFGNQVGD